MITRWNSLERWAPYHKNFILPVPRSRWLCMTNMDRHFMAQIVESVLAWNWNVFAAYNVSIRQAYNLPFATHRYLIQSLIQHPHIEIRLCSWFIKFVENKENCCKNVIRLLSELCKTDNRTVYCSNIVNISKQCSVDPNMICQSIVKTEMQYFKIPVGEEWRTDLLMNVVLTKLGHQGVWLWRSRTGGHFKLYLHMLNVLTLLWLGTY